MNRTEIIGLLLHITHSHREAGVREDAWEPERGTICPTADVPCVIHATNRNPGFEMIRFRGDGF